MKSLNKTKIDWCDMTFNPVTGCLHGCEYCYARGIANRFGLSFAPRLDEVDGAKYDSEEGLDTMLELNKPYYKDGRMQPYPMAFLPTFHKYRLDEPKLKTKSQKIFVGSMTDLFGEWVPDEWIKEVYDKCKKADHHTYLFLSKNPKRYKLINRNELDYRCNMWFGTSATESKSFLKNSCELFTATTYSKNVSANRFISIEPLLEEVNGVILELNIRFYDWVIIGAETGNRKCKVIPKREWIDSIVEQCKAANIPVFMKESLRELMGNDFIQAFPDNMINKQ